MATGAVTSQSLDEKLRESIVQWKIEPNLTPNQFQKLPEFYVTVPIDYLIFETGCNSCTENPQLRSKFNEACQGDEKIVPLFIYEQWTVEGIKESTFIPLTKDDSLHQRAEILKDVAKYLYDGCGPNVGFIGFMGDNPSLGLKIVNKLNYGHFDDKIAGFRMIQVNHEKLGLGSRTVNIAFIKVVEPDYY